LNTSICQITKW